MVLELHKIVGKKRCLECARLFTPSHKPKEIFCSKKCDANFRLGKTRIEWQQSLELAREHYRPLKGLYRAIQSVKSRSVLG